MARRSVTDEMEYPLLEQREGQEAAQSRGARRVRASRKERDGQVVKKTRVSLFYWVLPFAALAAAFLLALGFHQVESFLLKDARFHFAGPEEYGQDPPGLRITGMHRASKAEILRVFEPDYGRSLYLFPVEERRRNLLAVTWVGEATVSRRWPNRVDVNLVERKPVAFAQVSSPEGAPRFQLIDADGVLLPMPRGEKFENFVVLTGLSGRGAEAYRKARVRLAMRMLREVGAQAAAVSEVDVHDPDNLQATMRVNGDVVMARLGNRNFHSRVRNFVTNYPGIHNARPKARTFDLRIDDRITAVEGDESGQ
ncbi:MAG: FtsQ-type POTRA domain-containing protein [Bryobacterales bacterium]|nr:FtsQ-type POTRA domain-containing protein [Bryobacterales bacterium]